MDPLFDDDEADRLFELEEAKLDVLEYDETCCARQTQFFSTSNCTSIFRDLIRYLRVQQVQDYYVSKTQWKCKFECKGVKVTCQILQVQKDKVCVEFTRRMGDQLGFFNLYQEMAKHLELHNDTTH